MGANAVVIATDAAQFPAALFLADRLVRLEPPRGTEITVFCDSDEAIAQGVRWAGVHCNIRKITVPVAMSGYNHVSGATYYRFFAPGLSGATGRVLYLDTDTYPENRDIWRLFDIDMGPRAIAAVRSLEYAFGDVPWTRQELETAHCRDGKYLNAGMLLFYVARTAELRLNEKFLAAVQRNAGRSGYTDQTAINSVMRGQWAELSPAFNMTSIGYLIDLPATCPPGISHFTGEMKPWHGQLFPTKHRARGEIEQFLAASPWPKYVENQMKLRGWTPGQKVTHNIVAPPPGFADKVRAFIANTKFADVTGTTAGRAVTR